MFVESETGDVLELKIRRMILWKYDFLWHMIETISDEFIAVYNI